MKAYTFNLEQYKIKTNVLQRIVAYLDGLPPIGDLRQAKVNALRGLQSQSQEELDALLPSVLDRAFKGEL